MKTYLWILGLLVGHSQVWAQEASVPTMAPTAYPGPRIEDYKNKLRAIYPDAIRFEEKMQLPVQSGGSTLMGLIGRILGDSPNFQTEGIRSRRYIYQAFDKDRTLGAAHGTLVIVDDKVIPVFAFYDSYGKVLDVRVENLPEHVHKEFTDRGLLKQFVNRALDDFEVTRGKKGRITSQAPVMSKLKLPNANEANRYFRSIVRSLRFNASFMDIAHFITQHPELSDNVVAELHPEHLEALTPAVPLSGPEAFVREKASTSPFPLILPNPSQNPIKGASNGR